MIVTAGQLVKFLMQLKKIRNLKMNKELAIAHKLLMMQQEITNHTENGNFCEESYCGRKRNVAIWATKNHRFFPVA